MNSFTFADCPTTLSLTDTERDGKKVSAGSLSFTVRNTTKHALLGRLSVEPEEMADSGWFEIEGAPPQNPAEHDMDFEPGATQTARLKIAVPEGAPPGPKVFNLRVTTERDPDNDFADSPAVAFEVKAAAPKVAPKKLFPWWIPAAAVVAAVVVGSVFWKLRPQAPPPSSTPAASTTPGPTDGAKSGASVPSSPAPPASTTAAPTPKKCAAGWDIGGTSGCMKQCPAPFTSVSEICQAPHIFRPSAANSPGCTSGLTLVDGECFNIPPGSEMKVKYFLMKPCTNGWHDDGAGYCVSDRDPSSKTPRSSVISGSPPNQCSNGATLVGSLCYDPCPQNFPQVGNVGYWCFAACPSGFADLAEGRCQRPTDVPRD